jgi:hypothetical protein
LKNETKAVVVAFKVYVSAKINAGAAEFLLPEAGGNHPPYKIPGETNRCRSRSVLGGVKDADGSFEPKPSLPQP